MIFETQSIKKFSRNSIIFWYSRKISVEVRLSKIFLIQLITRLVVNDSREAKLVSNPDMKSVQLTIKWHFVVIASVKEIGVRFAS